VLEEYNPRGILRDLSDVLLAEMDYDREAADIEFFRKAFAKDNGFKIPAVIEGRSKKRVPTEERVKGRKPSDVSDLPKNVRVPFTRVVNPLLRSFSRLPAPCCSFR
jgi:predicted unusual protein kinase regulating ubiquinone biosynthesis (AarF/ABC1/UbiB family)